MSTRAALRALFNPPYPYTRERFCTCIPNVATQLFFSLSLLYLIFNSNTDLANERNKYIFIICAYFIIIIFFQRFKTHFSKFRGVPNWARNRWRETRGGFSIHILLYARPYLLHPRFIRTLNTIIVIYSIVCKCKCEKTNSHGFFFFFFAVKKR